MSDFVVRPAAEGEQRLLFDVLARSLHILPVGITDEMWEKRKANFPADRKIAAFSGDRPIGVASSIGTAMAVPGGNVVPARRSMGSGSAPTTPGAACSPR